MDIVKDDLGSYTSGEVQRCPFPFLNRLLEEAPVYRDPGTDMYIVSRYEDINYVNSHPEIFSSKEKPLKSCKLSCQNLNIFQGWVPRWTR